MEVLNLCAVQEELCFTHGDTFVWERIVKDELGAVVDISGFGYELSVNTTEDPVNEADQIFVMTGSIPTGTDGRVLFQISTANWASLVAAVASIPVTVYYDIEQTDGASNLRTVRKGPFKVEQDINKP